MQTGHGRTKKAAGERNLVDFLKKTFKKLAERFKSLTGGQKTRLFVLVALVAIIIVAASVLLNRKSYDVLYSGMDSADAGEVLTLLSEMGVDAKTQGSDTILVDSAKADAVRMQLAAEGYPQSGYNYDIFALASGLGATDVEKNVYLQFQLQEHLRQAILTFSEVEDVVVNLSLSKDNNFVLNTDEIPATASVVLKLREGAAFTNAKARTIAELCTSVRGLKVENVRIMDSELNLYDLSEQDDYAIVTDQLSLQRAVRENLKEQVVTLLTPVFGPSGVLAEVNVALDFDDATEESVVFNPPVEGMEDGLAVSIKELAETVKGEDAAGEVSGTEANGTGDTSVYPNVEGDENSVYSSVSKEANYELNEIRTQIKRAKGRIVSLSVSVLLDSSVLEEDYTESVRNLVATAIGVDVGRITVERLPFARLSADSDISAAYNAQKEMLAAANQAQIVRMLITAGTVIAVFLLLLAVIRTLARPAKAVKEIEGGVEGEQPVYYEGDYDRQSEFAEDAAYKDDQAGAVMDFAVGEDGELPPEGAEPGKTKKGEKKGKLRGWGGRKGGMDAAGEMSAEEAERATAEAEAEEAKIPLPEIEIKEDQNLTQLENFIEKNPEAVALLLRSWLSDER